MEAKSWRWIVPVLMLVSCILEGGKKSFFLNFFTNFDATNLIWLILKFFEFLTDIATYVRKH